MRIDSVEDIANWARDRRAELGWSQSELGRRIDSTRFWVADLEAGKPTLELGLVLRALRAMGAAVEVRAPESSLSLGAAREAEAAVVPQIDLDEIVDADTRRG